MSHPDLGWAFPDWLGREDSNLRMAEPKSAALPLGYAPSMGLLRFTAGRFKAAEPAQLPWADWSQLDRHRALLVGPANRGSLSVSSRHHPHALLQLLLNIGG
jgi:hypothetical protein